MNISDRKIPSYYLKKKHFRLLFLIFWKQDLAPQKLPPPRHVPSGPIW